MAAIFPVRAAKLKSHLPRQVSADTQISPAMANASHEIRTQLNGVLGMAALLKETSLDSDQERYVRCIDSAGKAMLKILNDILTQAKSEFTQEQLEAEEFDIRQFIDEIAVLFSQKAMTGGIVFDVFVSKDIPRQICLDKHKLRQVISNLLNNAFKFTSKGAITLSVDYLREGSSQITFSVRDTGIGIPASVIPKLFSDYTQASADTQKQFGGTGLGLSISKKLVTLMGGQIKVSSKPEKGSVFSFTVPVNMNGIPYRIGSAERDSGQPQTTLVVLTQSSRFYQNIAQHAQDMHCSVNSASDLYEAKVLIEHTPKSQRSVLLIDNRTKNLPEHALYSFLFNEISPERTRVALINPLSQGQPIHQEFRNRATVVAQPFNLERFYNEVIVHTESRPTLPVAEDPISRKKQILVVDDNQVNLDIASLFLKKLGYEATLVNSGYKAVALIVRNPNQFDAILMDCEMPGMNGYEATRNIRSIMDQHGLICPVLSLSGHMSDEHTSHAVASGMVGFIAKPFLLKDMSSELAKHIGQNRTEMRVAAFPEARSRSRLAVM
jgi:CheY-like chemotaxis protein